MNPAAEVVLRHGIADADAYTAAPPAIGVGPRPLDNVAHLEPRYGPYPFGSMQPVIGEPAISPTAAPGRTPWEKQFGEPGQTLSPASTQQPLPVASVPTVTGG